MSNVNKQCRYCGGGMIEQWEFTSKYAKHMMRCPKCKSEHIMEYIEKEPQTKRKNKRKKTQRRGKHAMSV